MIKITHIFLVMLVFLAPKNLIGQVKNSSSIIDPAKAPAGCRADYAKNKFVCLDGRVLDPDTMENENKPLTNNDSPENTDKKDTTDTSETKKENQNDDDKDCFYDLATNRQICCKKTKILPKNSTRLTTKLVCNDGRILDIDPPSQENTSSPEEIRSEQKEIQTSQSSSKKEKQLRIGLDLNLLIPVNGAWKDFVKYGIGGIAVLEYKPLNEFSLNFRAGYIKLIPEGLDDAINLSIIPITVGIKAGSKPMYIAIDAGYINSEICIDSFESPQVCIGGKSFGGNFGVVLEILAMELRVQANVQDFKNAANTLGVSVNLGFRFEP